MLFHRLAVSHFKGIRNVEIHFAPRGITLIEGRNEIGKSSLVHALTALFDVPISRTRGKLAHIIPRDGSGTPGIELEAESGEYRFVFRKSFVENKAVELTLLAPRPERYEGGEAKERLERILNETLDRALWKALMLQQGSEVGLPEVRDQQALMGALDSAVAGGGAPDAEGLFDRVRAEYLKYYNAGHGGELQRLGDLRLAAEEAAAAAKEARERLSDLKNRIDESRRLRQALRSLDGREAAERRARHECGELLVRVGTLEKALDAEKAKRERAREIRRNAERGLEPLRRLAVLESGAWEALESADGALEAARSRAEEAALADGKARALADGRARELDFRERLAELRRADCEQYRDMSDLERLRESRRRVDASRSLVRAAEEKLAGNAITDAAAAEIRAAEGALALARARAEGLAPKVRLDALAAGPIVLNGGADRLAQGEKREFPVLGSTRIEIPGILSVTVTAGEDDPGSQSAIAEERLRALLAKYGVSDPADVPVLAEGRREAERIIADGKRMVEETLRDSAREGGAGGLAERISELEERIAGYLRRRPADPPFPPDADAARRERDDAENARAAAAEDHRGAMAAREAARAARETANEEVFRLEAERKIAGRDLERIRLGLAESRSAAADGDLEKAFADADAAFSDASRTVAVIEAELGELGPELLRDRLAGLEKALAATEREKAETRTRLARLEGELDQLGGNGLHEKLADADARLQHRNGLLDAELRRAEAAKLLWETVSEARERSQKSYVLPLRRQIEDLARSVYGVAVEVRLTPDLRIASRTMDGLEVAFSELSGGAREQFSLIHRAACSLAVAKDGGVPLILDDALGYSDVHRLIGMNEVLSRAAQKCQIIILTCMPGRYAYVEPAARIDMEKIRGLPPG